jgi:quinol monooxygenase YgiN
MLAIIAKLPIKEEKLDEAIEAMKELMVEVAKEEGALHYTLNVDRNNPNQLVVIERYQDKAALEYHGGTPHFQAFFAKAAELLDGQPEMTVYKELASI